MALVTIENILQLDGFQNAKVVAGKAGMHLMVNNAMLMEVPDIFPYVEKNNLLITTLFIGSAISGLKIEALAKSMIPMYIVMIVTLLVITYFPAVVMTVPALLMN